MTSLDAFLAAPDATPPVDTLDPGTARVALITGSDVDQRRRAARAAARTWARRFPDAVVIEAPPAASWPFRYPLAPPLPASPAVVWADDVHEGIGSHQGAGTRLVTTQAAYLFAEWMHVLDGRADILLLACGDRGALQAQAPEALARRGPFRGAWIHDADASEAAPKSTAPEPRTASTPPDAATALLIEAFQTPDATVRLARAVEALGIARTPPALLAAASACMEVNDLEAAARDLDECLAQAPEWAAAHFERGKLWLRADDMERAAASFRAAADRLPGFGSAWANLGAALGELDRREEALEAFHRALAIDPDSHQALNNIGVVSRELGRLPESEAAFREVIARVPDLAFGHYNLGHTLFLQGRYHAALSAYCEGQRRDPDRNAVQATRLAVCRLATGDADGALRELQHATAGLPSEYRRQLLRDTSAILWALLTDKPDLPGWKRVSDWVSAAERQA